MSEILTREERDGLTMWGESIAVQVRNEGRIAIHLMEDAPNDGYDVLLMPGDVAKLRAFLDEAQKRGEA